MGYSVEKLDTATAPESVLEELARLCDVIDEEELPGDPPTPTVARIEGWRHPREHWQTHYWVARDKGDIAAYAFVFYDRDQNLENAYFRFMVRPDLRKRGLARTLAGPLFDHLDDNGRSRITTWVMAGAGSEGFARMLGLKSVLQEKRSRLQIADVDVDLMNRWIDTAAERAADYELRQYQSPFPVEILQKYCDLAFVMNTAPLEDFEQEDEVLTPDKWRDTEKSVIASKKSLHTVIAVHKPSDEFAGFSTIQTHELDPSLAWQWDTGVDPAHRNKGLGRWLKAANILRIIEGFPSVDRVDTFNAGSNEPMLNINIEMGFKPIAVETQWQGRLNDAREALGV